MAGSRPQDDAIIGVAFKASVKVMGVAAVMAFIGWLGWQWLTPAEPEWLPAAAPDLARLLAAPDGMAASIPVFTDITTSAGIDMVHVSGAYGDRLLPETMGGGVAIFDFNNNGHQDLLFVNSGRWPFAEGEAPVNTLRLYENNGRGQFHEVTERVGLDGLQAYGMGVAVADYDGDGWVDILLTAVGRNRLLRNLGGHFIDVTDLAGVAGGDDEWSTGAAFFDANGNGLLDLFVTNYVVWSREIDFEVDYRLTGIGRAYGPPTNFAGTDSRLYFNLGDGRFEDVSATAGIQVAHADTGLPVGKGLAVMPVDLTGNGWLDVVVANDTVRNFAFINQGEGQFVELGTELGLGFDRNGLATGAMGIDAARFRDDDALGIVIGNFANEMSSFYVGSPSRAVYADEAIGVGIGGATRLALTFGVFFFDYDLDGRLDVLQANGHVENDINRVQASQQYAQSAQLFWHCAEGCSNRFVMVPRDQLGDLGQPIVGRGAAYGDLTGNGRLDVVMTQIDGPPLVLRNDLDLGHHWLRVRLRGAYPNRDAIGAEVMVEAGGVVQHRQIMPTRSYLSQVELPVTFGLGGVDQVDRVRVRWPDGTEQVIERPPVDQQLIIEHPDRTEPTERTEPSEPVIEVR